MIVRKIDGCVSRKVEMVYFRLCIKITIAGYLQLHEFVL